MASLDFHKINSCAARDRTDPIDAYSHADVRVQYADVRVAYSQERFSVSDFAQTVKQQVDIVKSIEGYIRLRKAGAQNYSGLCPFHKEKSPSFSVHAVRQFYQCFGCGVSGDVFSFVGKIENVGFPEAVRIVAQKNGIPLPPQEKKTLASAAETVDLTHECPHCHYKIPSRELLRIDREHIRCPKCGKDSVCGPNKG